MSKEATGDQIREAVRERYASAARQVKVKKAASCCSGSSCCDSGSGGISGMYDASQLRDVPQDAALASLGCGNPTLLAELKPGETVLDLGSGGGIDVLLSARRVGAAGKAYGLDMTDEMLELARNNAKAAGVSNVEFLKGHIEAIPLPDATVDVIISNCVINLSADKDAVLKEAFRVLKPGGRFAVADIVVQGGVLPPAVRQALSLWAGCISGALSDTEYMEKLREAGFSDVGMEVLKVYTRGDLPEDTLLGKIGADSLDLPKGTRIVSAFVKATKPASASVGEGGTGASACGCGGSTGSGQVKEYFKQVATQWDDMREGYFTEAVREAAIARAGVGPESVVADVGSGTGFMLAGVAPLVKKAYAVDNSPEMLQVAAKNLSGYGDLEFVTAEGHSIPLADGQLDAVFANMYLHHAPNPAASIAEMSRVLKPGGRLVITDLDKHDNEWMKQEMADVWLGFERPQVEAWFREAGLKDAAVDCTGTSCCGSSCDGARADISVFVASGTK